MLSFKDNESWDFSVDFGFSIFLIAFSQNREADASHSGGS